MTTKKNDVKVEEAVEAQETLESKDVSVSSALTTTADGGQSGDWEFADAIEGAQMTLSQIPALKLTQNMTPEVTSRDYPDIYAGMYINDLTKEVISDDKGEVRFRLISMWQSRVKFPPRESGNTSIECSCPTYNARTRGLGDVGTTYGDCAKCMYNNWDSKEKCTPQYTLVIALNDNPHDLYRVILSRTSYKAGSTFSSALKTLMYRFAKEKLPLFMFEGILTAKEVKNPRINAMYFVSNLEAAPVKEAPTMDESLREEFTQAYNEIRTMREQQITFAKQRAEENMNERNEARDTADTFNSISSNIADEMGLTDSAEAPTVENEKVPF